MDDILTPEGAATKRDGLLDAAVGVFARYGFRKTSMDEVARAAGVSRQGLYLHFTDKEALFRHAVEYKLTRQLRSVKAELADAGIPLERRLVAACDEWTGRYVGVHGGDAADLMCASNTLASATLTIYSKQFEDALAEAIGASPLAGFCAASGFRPADLAHALHATVRGLKQCSTSRQDFMASIAVAVHMFCAPLDDAPLPPE